MARAGGFMPVPDGYYMDGWWTERRLPVIEASKHLCSICGSFTISLQVHHITYMNIGQERDKDLIPLCKRCHGTVHCDIRSQRAFKPDYQKSETYRPVRVRSITQDDLIRHEELKAKRCAVVPCRAYELELE